MADWYRQLDGQSTGPFSLEELRFFRDRGTLAADDEVRQGNSGPWRKAGSLVGLFPTARQAVGPAAASGLTAGTPTPSEPPKPEPKQVEPPTPPAKGSARPPLPARSAVAYADDSLQASNRDRLLITLAVGAGLAMLLMLLLLLLLWLFGGIGGGGEGVASRGSGTGGGTGGGIGAGSGDSSGDGTEGEGEGIEEDGPSAGTSDTDVLEDVASADDGIREVPVDEPAEEPSDQPPQEASSGMEVPEADPVPKSAFSIARLPSGDPPPAAGGSGSSGGGGGSGAEFEERLEREGAKSGDVQISLIWNNYNDLDLHMECPSGEEVFYQHKRSRCSGELDVDMNAGGRESREPVENIYWPPGQAPKGKFVVGVHHYANHGDRDPTRFSVSVKVDGTTRQFSGTISHGQRKVVHQFTRR